MDGVGLAEPAHGGERLDRAGQVVDHLEGHDEVVGAGGDLLGQLAGDVDDLELHAVADAGFGGVLAGGGDRRLVVVEAVDPNLREGLGQGDRRPALAAADLGDSGAGPCRAGRTRPGIVASQSRRQQVAR